MKHRRAAASYAKALLAVAKERNQAEVVSRELGGTVAMFESDEELRDFFARPWIPATAKRAVAMEVAQRSDLSKLASDFLVLLAEREAEWLHIGNPGSGGLVNEARDCSEG